MQCRKYRRLYQFQSTLPVGGATIAGKLMIRDTDGFQSTLPVGGATLHPPYTSNVLAISIHAPRGGSDVFPFSAALCACAFQSTLPVGGATPALPLSVLLQQEFQSTLPVGGATLLGLSDDPQGYISIHAPRGGSDQSIFEQFPGELNFNPRSPWGERRERTAYEHGAADFNPRSPWGERRSRKSLRMPAGNFNPRSPWGERQFLRYTS